MAEDITRLLPADTYLGSIDKKLHVHTIISDCHVCPLVGNVARIGVNGGRFVCAVSFKGEEETGLTIPMFTDGLNAQQPTSVAGGIKTFVV